MAIHDCYKTLASTAEGVYKEKSSRFLAFAHPVMDEDEIKTIVLEYKKKYFDARHHCYAWQLGLDGNHYRANDDGEPSGTAGKPILGQIHSYELTNLLIVVVRYFGGTKLGTGGLIQAYKKAAGDAIENGSIIQKTVDDYFRVEFDYAMMNDVMKALKDGVTKIIGQNYELSCWINFCLPQSQSPAITNVLSKIESVKLSLLYTR